jgi:hypothetical protein
MNRLLCADGFYGKAGPITVTLLADRHGCRMDYCADKGVPASHLIYLAFGHWFIRADLPDRLSPWFKDLGRMRGLSESPMYER